MKTANGLLNQSFIYDFSKGANGAVGFHSTGCQVPINSSIVSYSLIALSSLTYNIQIGDGTLGYSFCSANGATPGAQFISNNLSALGATTTNNISINIIGAPITTGQIFCSFQYIPLESKIAITNIIPPNPVSALNIFTQKIPAIQFQKLFSNPIQLLPPLAINEYSSLFLESLLLTKESGTIPYDFIGTSVNITWGPRSDSNYIANGQSAADAFNTINEVQFFFLTGLQYLPILGKDVQFNIDSFDATQGDGDVTMSFLYSKITQ